MNFKLVLVPKTPEEVLLYPETPLAGLKFVEVAGQCLRRSIDTEVRHRHVTLGRVTQYEITVPTSVAIASGWFTKSDKRYLLCADDVLSEYIFYGASMTRVGNTVQMYPYYTNEVVLVSYIDELAFIQNWVDKGYPDYVYKNSDPTPGEEDHTDSNADDNILDGVTNDNP